MSSQLDYLDHRDATRGNIAETNIFAGQLLAGQTFWSHSLHPSTWIMVCRAIGDVKVRRLSDNHEAVIPHKTRLYASGGHPDYI